MVITLFFILNAAYLLASATEINAADSNCVVSLKEATRNGDLDAFKKIVGNGCDANIKDDDENTPIHWASKMGKLNIVKYLVEQAGANVNNPGWIGYTSLHMAANSYNADQLNVVKYLVENCTANVNKYSTYGYLPINIAAQNGNLNIVKYLLPRVNIDYKNGNTPIHDAAIMGHLNVIKYLVEETSADVNAKDANDDTPLHWAAVYGHLDIVKYLVNNLHADVNARNNRGQTPQVAWLQNNKAL